MNLPTLCLFTDSLAPSGMGEVMLTLACELQARYRVLFVCPPTSAGLSLLSRMESIGVQTLALPKADEHDHQDVQALKQWLTQQKVTIFNCHAGIGWEGHHGIYAATLACVPVIIRTEHLPYLLTDHNQRFDHHKLLEMVDGLICVSNSAYQSFLAAGMPEDKLYYVPNGINLPPIGVASKKIRDSLNLGLADKLVVTVGRLCEQKNYHTLLKAIPQVLEHIPNAHFVWVGVGPLEEELRREITRLNLEKSVCLVGHRNDVPQILASADLFVLPSLFEGLPIVVLEAMAAGLPIVGSWVSGISDLVGNGLNGRLVEKNDSVGFAKAIIEVLESPRKASDWGWASRRRVQQEFQAPRMATQTAQVYQRFEDNGLKRLRKFRRERMNHTNVGFIGAGGIASRHVGSLQSFGDVRIVAIADPAFERAEEQAHRCGAKAYRDYHEMLAHEELDAIYICVPPFAHGSIEMDVIKQQLPFFVEKPLSVDYATAAKIGQAVEATGLVTAVGYHWRYLNTVERAQELLRDRPARLVMGYWLDQTPPPAWWGREEQSGGQMIEQTTHIFDLARLLVGEVQSVQAFGSQIQRPTYPDLNIQDASIATLRFESGAIGSIASTCLLGWPHRIGLHLFADRMVLEISEHEIMIDVGEGRPIEHVNVDPFVCEDRDFIDAVQGKENRIRAPYAEALRTHKLVTQATQIARQHDNYQEANQREAAHV